MKKTEVNQGKSPARTRSERHARVRMLKKLELSAKQILLQNDQCNFCLPVLRLSLQATKGDQSPPTGGISDLILQKEHK